MLFNSFEFLIFFAVVFTLYCALNMRWQNRMLLSASYIFYGWVEPRFVVLMALTTIFDYFSGIKIDEATSHAVKKRWLTVSIMLNLCLLGTFKYFGFCSENLRAIFHAFGLQANWGVIELMLPAGISFYTFHEISYVTDIYRGHIKAARNFEDFAVFISFFPQLVAGPIGRASWQMPQFQKSRRVTYDGCAEGLALFVTGLFRKVVVADPLGALARPVFEQPGNCSRLTLLLGLYCFSFQIYADFAGYSEMARGLARVMGFELIQNFSHPYFSTNITDFWRRWHISLSTWLRDYLYIPLGGNRHGTFRTYLNLFLTMFLGGLWHGASWTFAAWGSLHGIYLALHKLMLSKKTPRNDGRFVLLLKGLVTFHLVAFTWIFFASKTFGNAFTYTARLFVSDAMPAAATPVTLNGDSLGAAAAGLALMLLLVDLPQYLKKDSCAMLRWRFAWRAAGFSIIVLASILTRGAEHVPFIYFKF